MMTPIDKKLAQEMVNKIIWDLREMFPYRMRMLLAFAGEAHYRDGLTITVVPPPGDDEMRARHRARVESAVSRWREDRRYDPFILAMLEGTQDPHAIILRIS